MARSTPDSKVHGANMGPTWVLSTPDGPHVGPMIFAIRGCYVLLTAIICHPLSTCQHKSEGWWEAFYIGMNMKLFITTIRPCSIWITINQCLETIDWLTISRQDVFSIPYISDNDGKYPYYICFANKYPDEFQSRACAWSFRWMVVLHGLTPIWW